MPRLVVIMPAHNAAETIDTAVSSTLRAMPRDSALHIWNDGSDDETSAVVQRISDARVRLFEGTVSRGSGFARARLIEGSDSEFVANMDADDYCLPWRFSLQGVRLQTCDVVFSTMIRFWPNRRILPQLPISYRPEELRVALLVHNPLNHSSMTAKREAVSAVDGYRDVRFGQDYDLWLRLASGGWNLFRDAVPGIGYRQTAAQVSQRPDYWQKLRQDVRISEAYAQLMQKAASDLGLKNWDPSAGTEKDRLISILEEAIPRLRWQHRKYYERVMRVYGSSWRDPAWPT